MISIVFDAMADRDDDPVPADNPLETGFVSHGPACAPTGAAMFNTSQGISYGEGQRYAHEETRFITKVPSKHDKTRGE